MQNLASRSLVDDVLKKVNRLKPIADELGVPLSQLAIAWCASNPNVSSVITGATKENQVSIMPYSRYMYLFCALELFLSLWLAKDLGFLVHFHFRPWLLSEFFLTLTCRVLGTAILLYFLSCDCN